MPETINAMFLETTQRHAELPALSYRAGGRYQAITYRELSEQVRQCAAGLKALGLRPGDRVVLLAENRPEWVVTDLAVLALEAVDAPIFTSLPARQVEFIVGDCGASMLVVSGGAQLEKAQEVRRAHPQLQLVAFDVPEETEEGVTSFAEVMALGAAAGETEAEYRAQSASARPEDLASIVYTSGTTGDPKGVLLTHGNFLANLRSCQEVLHFTPQDVLLSFLPLNHCLERLAGYYLPLACGAQIAFTESLRRLRENLREVRPTYMILVPRMYQAFHEAILANVERQSPWRRRLFAWALNVGEKRVRAQQQGRGRGLRMRLAYGAARGLVFRKLRAAMGFQRLHYFVSGGAALAPATEGFFHAVGLPILEGYGLTEAAPVVTVNRPGKLRLGTVGPPLPGVELRLSPQGEVLIRGENVMQGYYERPEETAAALDEEGWLHTGDIAELDEAGHLRITDRLKDILVLSNAKNVAPQPIENALVASPYLAQVVLVGDQRPYVTALVVPAFERIREWAREGGLDLPEDAAGLANAREVRRLVQAEIARLSEDLADYEKVRDFVVLEREFSIEAEELTPTMKVRRRRVAEKYEESIRAMYR
jgi:long-chain acyl-CoA synthetase